MHFVCNISLQSLSKYTPTLSNFKHLNELISLSGTYYEKKLSSIQLVIQKYVNLLRIQYSWFFSILYIPSKFRSQILGESVIDYIKETTQSTYYV